MAGNSASISARWIGKKPFTAGNGGRDTVRHDLGLGSRPVAAG